MRQMISLSRELGSISATSHSSLDHTSDRHQSPDPRQGPAAQTTRPRIRLDACGPRALTRAGFPPVVSTSTRHAGRKILKPMTDCELWIVDCGFAFLPTSDLWP